MSNVVKFRRPARQEKPPAPSFNVNNSNEWKQAVRAAWADPNRWRVSRHGDSYVVIDEISVVAVIERTEQGYWTWTIRFRDGREPVKSKWTYTGERIALDEALDAVIVLA